jgi:RNase P protein component
MSKGCKQAQHELAANRDQINRQIREAMRQASESMKAYGPELQKSMRELQHELDNIHIDFDDMQ